MHLGWWLGVCVSVSVVRLARCLGKGPIGVKMLDEGRALVVDSYVDALVIVDVVLGGVLGMRLLDSGSRGTGVMLTPARDAAFVTSSGGYFLYAADLSDAWDAWDWDPCFVNSQARPKSCRRRELRGVHPLSVVGVDIANVKMGAVSPDGATLWLSDMHNERLLAIGVADWRTNATVPSKVFVETPKFECFALTVGLYKGRAALYVTGQGPRAGLRVYDPDNATRALKFWKDSQGGTSRDVALFKREIEVSPAGDTLWGLCTEGLLRRPYYARDDVLSRVCVSRAGGGT